MQKRLFWMNARLKLSTHRIKRNLRLLPLRGNYNFYIYCYQTDKLERMAALPSRESSVSNYDLSSVENIAVSAKLARERASQEPDQSSYNTAWLHGFADALDKVATQLEPQRGLEATTHKKMNRRKQTHER